MAVSPSSGLFLMVDACCLFVLWGDAGARSVICSDSPPALTAKLLSTVCCVRANADFSATQVFVWRVGRLLVGTLSILGEAEVGGLCRCVQFQLSVSSFHPACVFFFPFSFSVPWIVLASRVKQHWQIKKEWECDTEWKGLCERASNEYNFCFRENSLVFCRDPRFACKYVGEWREH